MKDIKNIKHIKAQLRTSKILVKRLGNTILGYRVENEYLERRNNILEARMKYLLKNKGYNLNFNYVKTKLNKRSNHS